MHPQNLFASFYVRKVDRDLPVETTRSQQRWVENVRAVCCGDDNDTFLGVEPVHLYQQGIERLLALIMSTADTVTAMAAYSVNFIDENNTRRGLLALLEHIANPRRSDANEHLQEIRAAEGKE